MRTTCVKCGNPLEKSERGRPPTYCSKACRRSAEFEIKRANRHLEKLEALWMSLDKDDFYGSVAHHERQLADCERNINKFEARLLLLLEDSTE